MSSHNALLIDANALLHRAWHALPPLTSRDGRLVNAVYGFTSVLLKILDAERPDVLAVCWDTAAPTFRHEAAPEYKAQREEQPQDFYNQVPLAQEVVRALGGTNVFLDGYEADDLIGTLSRCFAEQGVSVSILTSDRDAWQLIGPMVRVIAFKKGVSETVVYDEALLRETTGLSPAQIIDYKAMRGDASDNLKGMSGIGEKTATDLLRTYHSLEQILRAAHDPASSLTPSVRQKLILGESAARATLPLVTIVTHAPIDCTMQTYLRRPVDSQAVSEVFFTLGFKTLLKRALAQEGAASTQDTSPAVAAVVAGRRETAAVLADVISLVQDARREGQLIVHPLFLAQGSLFSDLPVLALGTAHRSVLLTATLFKQTEIFAALRDALEDAALHKVGHGLKQAWHWCHDRAIALRGLAFDTELASYVLAAGEGGHELPILCATYLHQALSESESRPFEEIDALRALHASLSAALDRDQVRTVFDRMEIPLISVLAQMEVEGILIDRTYFTQQISVFRAEKQRLEMEMIQLAGEPFNPASPTQLAHILFDVLKLSTRSIKRGKTGFSTAAAELEKLEGLHPIIAHISEYREVAKLLSTYVEALPAQADAQGRVHTTFNQSVTSTGRLSSTNPNLQNIPIRTELGRTIRRGFIAKPGFQLLSCDYSQIELRVIAALSQDAHMLQAFARREDIHTATAATMWQIPLDQVTKDQRRAAKAINFGVIYGQGPHGLAKSAGVSFEEARQFIEEYFTAYPGIRAYMEQTKALAHRLGYVESLFGRRRPISDIASPLPQVRATAERMAINMPVQGTAADLMKLAMIRLVQELPRISAESCLLLQVHDEVVLEVPTAEVAHVAREVADILEHIEQIGVPIVVGAKYGSNWEELTEVERTETSR